MNAATKPIKDYKKLYSIDTLGRVFSFRRNRFLAPRVQSRYLCVTLIKDGIQKHVPIHRLVAIHFIKNPNNYPSVNHKNANRNDNTLKNLEWCTPKQNTHHAMRMGLLRYTFSKYRNEQTSIKCRHPLYEKRELILSEYKSNKTMNYLAKKYGTTRWTIAKIIHNKYKAVTK